MCQWAEVTTWLLAALRGPDVTSHRAYGSCEWIFISPMIAWALSELLERLAKASSALPLQ
jgi:hypothetical protein